MEWINKLPDTPGEYIVMTETELMKKKQVMFAQLTINEEGEKSWSFKRQNFVAYLSE